MSISLIRSRGGFALVCGLFVLFVFPAAAAATTGADLRVVGPDGQTLAEHRQYTGGVKIKTDPDAECFGEGTGGSGDRVKVPGPTGLGIVKDALAMDRDLRPLSVTDAFEFGLGVCGIGGFESQGESFWYLKHNRAGSQVGGDQLRLTDGDEVLWYFAPGFPPPPELSLEAPARARPGDPFQVRVFEYADDGKRSPASGATVSGGSAPAATDAQGKATVVVAGPGTAALQATRDSDIPSNRAQVCVNADQKACPNHEGELIVGTGKRDRVEGTRGSDTIRARGGNDLVSARDGEADQVNCGSGRRDVAEMDGTDTARRCERVIRK